jgi:hypothetical protein
MVDGIYKKKTLFGLIWLSVEILKNTQDANEVRLKMPTFSDLTPLMGCHFITKKCVTIKNL